MTVKVVAHAAALAAAAADVICDAVRAEPALVLGLPTGATPIATYAEIARRDAAGEADLSRVTAFAIDEFAGCPREAPGTNAAFFRQHIVFRLAALHCPDASAPDPASEVGAFALRLRQAGGMGLCVLGIGVNGHIAFNEPGSPSDARARVVELAPESRAAHAEAFGGLDRVPARGTTLGVADILAARSILVLAHGASKASIVRRALHEAPSAAVPASWLQGHSRTTWLLDAAAARDLPS